MSENRYGVISGMRSAEDRQLAIARLESEGIPTDRIFRADPEEPNAPPVWLCSLSANSELLASSLTALNRLDRKGFSDRTKIALQEAKARGQRLGRKPSMTDLHKAIAIQMIEAGYKGTKIWKTLTVLEGSPLSQSAYSIRSLRNSALRSRLLNGCVRNRAGACG